MRLFDLTEQYQDLLDLLQDDTDNEQLQSMLEGLSGKIEEKAENLAKVIKSIEANEDVLDAEIKRLTARKKTLTNNRNSLKTMLQLNMERLNTKKITGSLFTVSLQKNPPKVNVLDEESIPEHYSVVPDPPEPVLNKKKVLDDLKAGIEIPGVEMVQEQSLRIK